jgi:hypothetical protein
MRKRATRAKRFITAKEYELLIRLYYPNLPHKAIVKAVFFGILEGSVKYVKTTSRQEERTEE